MQHQEHALPASVEFRAEAQTAASAFRTPVVVGLAGGLSFVLVVVLDLLTSPMPVTWRALACGAGLASVAGSLLGLGAGGGLLVLARCPTWLRYFAYAAPGVIVASKLISDLGVVQKWGGRYATAAAIAAVASAGAGVLLSGGLLLLALATGGESFRRFSRVRRGATAALALCVALLILWMDAVFYVDTYLVAHGMMRIVSLLLILAAVALVVAPTLRRLVVRGAFRAVVFLALWLFVGASAAALAEPPGDYHLLLSRRYAGKMLLLGRSALDFDRDGYAWGLGGGDCAPFDANIHPFARDVPGNGVDEDCYGGDAVARPEPRGVRSDTPQALVARGDVATSVVLITADSLRPDRMSVYGASRDTTPNLRAWATNALRFDRAYTSGGWTHIALTSLFRGKYLRHIAWTEYVLTSRYRLVPQREWESGSRDRSESEAEKFSMAADQHGTLHALLSERGYYTAAVLDTAGRPWRATEGSARVARAGARFVDLEEPGFGGFESYASNFEDPDWVTDEQTTERAVEMLRGTPSDRPFFLWVHYMGPHYPDSEHEGVPRPDDPKYGGYDHEVAYFDRAVGKLLEAIKEVQAERAVAVVLTSDHGEEFLGVNRHHGQSVREAALRIPLLVSAPGVRSGMSDALVSLVDIMPTVLAITGTPVPSDLDGENLIAPAHGSNSRTIFAETWRVYGRGLASTINHVAALGDGWKVSLDVLLLDEHAHPLGDEDAERSTNDWPDVAIGLRRKLWDYLTSAGPVDRR
jgi:arylsulfatase A-like enzyme